MPIFLPVAIMAGAAGLPSSFGADLTSTSFASAGSANVSYPATNAFDNNTGTNWLTADAVVQADCWVRQDFGAANDKTIRKLTLRNSTHGGLDATYWSEGWKLQYSDDGTSWTDMLEWYSGIATLTKTDDGTTTDAYVFQSGGAHRYWRVQCVTASGQGANGWYTGLGEIEMMEAA